MADTPISRLADADDLDGGELVVISQRSPTVRITAATLSAQASDQSFNDSGNGFLTAGFAVDDYVNVVGFTGDAANNLYSGQITALTAGKMTIGGAEGAVIVDDAAGESVTIAKWVSRKAPYGGGGGGMCKQFAYITNGTGGNSSTAFATKGRLIIPLHDIVVDKIAFDFLAVVGATYVCRYGKMNSSGVITEIATAPDALVAGAAVQTYHSFDVPAFAIDANDRAFVLLSRTDGGHTYVLPIAKATSGVDLAWSLNFGAKSASLTIAKANPIVTDALNVGTIGNSSSFSGDLLFEYV